MSNIPVFTAVRIIPRDTDFLNRRVGARGEVFFDLNSNSLRIFNGRDFGGTEVALSDLSNVNSSALLEKLDSSGLALSDLSNVSSNDFLSKAESAGLESSVIPTLSEAPENPVNGKLWFNTDLNLLNIFYDDGDGGEWIQLESSDDGSDFIESNGFSSIIVAGADSISAETSTDEFSLVAGSNISITTNSNSKSITISATATLGTTSNSFETIAIAGQTSLIADSATDTLTLAAGTGITLFTNSGTDTITISSTASAFSTLTDVASATLTLDKIYLPAITMLSVTNSGATAYRFDQYGTTNNPTIYAINGTTIAFNLNISGHPFLIQNGAGSNYNTGLIHVSTTGEVSTGANAQGKTSGTLYWKIPDAISGGYRYQCQSHAPMVGSISIKNFGSI